MHKSQPTVFTKFEFLFDMWYNIIKIFRKVGNHIMPKTKKLYPRPQINWGALIIFIFSFIFSIIPLILNICISMQVFPNTISDDLKILIYLFGGYGVIFTIIFTPISISFLTENFIPSVRNRKRWNAERQQRLKEKEKFYEIYENYLDNVSNIL